MEYVDGHVQYCHLWRKSGTPLKTSSHSKLELSKANFSSDLARKFVTIKRWLPANRFMSLLLIPQRGYPVITRTSGTRQMYVDLLHVGCRCCPCGPDSWSVRRRSLCRLSVGCRQQGGGRLHPTPAFLL